MNTVIKEYLKAVQFEYGLDGWVGEDYARLYGWAEEQLDEILAALPIALASLDLDSSREAIPGLGWAWTEAWEGENGGYSCHWVEDGPIAEEYGRHFLDEWRLEIWGRD